MTSDGPRKKDTESEVLSREINAELQVWKESLLNDPSSYVPLNPFLVDIHTKTVYQLLIDKGITTQEEIDISYQKMVLKQLQIGRESLLEQRKKASTDITIPQKGIIIPNHINLDGNGGKSG